MADNILKHFIGQHTGINIVTRRMIRVKHPQIMLLQTVQCIMGKLKPGLAITQNPKTALCATLPNVRIIFKFGIFSIS